MTAPRARRLAAVLVSASLRGFGAGFLLGGEKGEHRVVRCWFWESFVYGGTQEELEALKHGQGSELRVLISSCSRFVRSWFLYRTGSSFTRRDVGTGGHPSCMYVNRSRYACLHVLRICMMEMCSYALTCSRSVSSRDKRHLYPSFVVHVQSH
jgi:hypothetical protein